MVFIKKTASAPWKGPITSFHGVLAVWVIIILL